jgi:hypothetical protein
MNGRCGGCVAGHDQRLDAVAGNQVISNDMRAPQHMGIITLAIGRVAVIGHIDKVLVGKFSLQRQQHAQAAHTAVKDTDGARAGGGSGQRT